MLHPDHHLDEGTIHAWLDNALSAEDAAVVAAHVASCPDCAAAVAEARGLIAAASRILGHLDDVRGDVIPVTPLRRALPWYRRTPVQAAAALLFVAFGTSLVLRERSHPVVASHAVTHQSTDTLMSTTTAAPATSTAASDMAVPPPAQPMHAMKAAVEPVPPNTARTLEHPAALPSEVQPSRAEAFSKAAPAPANVSSNAVMDTVAAQSAAVATTAVAGAPAARDALSTALKAPDGPQTQMRVASIHPAAPTKPCDTESLHLRPGITVTLFSTDSAALPACLPKAPAEIHTLQWTDSTTRRIQILRGPVPLAELDSLRHTLP